MDSPSADVRWLRGRLVAHEIGLLDEDEMARFERLLESDPACRAAWERFAAAAPDDAEVSSPHVPPGVLARWDRVSRSLRGLERRLIRLHLESCTACREDLVALGHEPFPAADPALEGDAPSTGPAAAAKRAAVPREERSPSSWARLRERWSHVATPWLSGWAVAATAALALVLFRGGPPGDGRAGLSLDAAPVVVLDARVRGGDGSALESSTSHVAVTLRSRPTGWAPGTPVRFVLRDAAGRRTERAGTIDEILGTRVLVLGIPPGSESMRLVLRVEPTAPDGPEPLEFPLGGSPEAR